MRVLRKVASRVLEEFENEKFGGDVPEGERMAVRGDSEEPLRGLVHGVPGTGKSRVIKWIRNFFEEALRWTHGTEFICAAFQNRMAAAIQGTTLHTAADLPRPGEDRAKKLASSDIDNLYAQNQSLRWILIDEISMVADELLGDFESMFADAARQTVYKKRRDKSRRIFGGYNLLTFGDWWQLPPIPETAALFRPPC